MRFCAVFIAVLLMSFTPALAEETRFQPEDEINMQSCIETVNDISADPKGEGPIEISSCIGTASNACMNESPDGQTTLGMVNCTARETAWWDAQLNSHYASLRDTMGAEEFAKLRDSQRLWLSFKQADCEFEYFYWREGTIRSIYGASCDLKHTAERTLALAVFLEWTNL